MKLLVTGGARSGKSAFAEQLALRLSDRGIYIATSRIWDGEMANRVELHRRQRSESGFDWETLEEPLMLAQRLIELQDRRDFRTACPPVVLVDCLTLWLSNLLLEEEKPGGVPDADPAAAGAEESAARAGSVKRDKAEEPVHPEACPPVAAASAGSLEHAVKELAGAAAAVPYPVIFVTNEVGSGIVPAYPLGRRFRDEAGRLNQRMAQICDRAFWVVSGIPVDLRKVAFAWEEL